MRRRTAFEVLTDQLGEVTGHRPPDGLSDWLCPTHDDRNPSLSVSNGDGKVLVHCQAGCDLDAVLSALGLGRADLFDRATTNESEHRRLVATYVYRDEEGRPLFAVDRWDPKRFSQRAADGKGGWHTGKGCMAGVRLVLYQLPALRMAIEAGEVIYVCEGEKDVHAVEAAGENATTNPMGADKWREHYTEALKGAAKVVIVADRDEAGYKRAREVAGSLRHALIPVEVLAPREGFKDVAEHLGAGHSLDELVPLESGDPVGRPPSDDEMHGDEAGGAPKAPARLKAGDTFVLDDPAELEPVWGSGEDVLWASGEATFIVSPTGAGKTTVGVQLVSALIGIDSELLGWPIQATTRPVLYLAMDRPRQIRRAMRRVFGEQHREALADRLKVREGPLPLDLGRVPEALVETALAAGAGTVILDSLKDAAVKLTDDEVGGNINRAIQLCVVAGIEVLVLHHQRKGQGGAKPTTLEDVYGSTWITAGAGSVILLWGAAGDLLVELSHLKQPAATVGPLTVEHDHEAGRTSVFRGVADPLVVLRDSSSGITALELARLMFEKAEPSDNQRKKAQRQLDRLVRDGHAHRDDGGRSETGQKTPARYHAVVRDGRS